jgi:hypothetical protein
MPASGMVIPELSFWRKGHQFFVSALRRFEMAVLTENSPRESTAFRENEKGRIARIAAAVPVTNLLQGKK